MFSRIVRTPPESPTHHPGISQDFVFLEFRGNTDPFWPPPLHVKDPHPTGTYPDPKFEFLFLFLVGNLSWEFPNLVVSNVVVCNFTRKHFVAFLCNLLNYFALFGGLVLAFFCVHLFFSFIGVFLRPTAFRRTAFRNFRLKPIFILEVRRGEKCHKEK